MPLARCVRAVGFPRTAPSPPKPHHNMLRFIACSVSSVCLSSSVFEIPFCDIRDKPADALTECRRTAHHVTPEDRLSEGFAVSRLSAFVPSPFRLCYLFSLYVHQVTNPRLTRTALS